MDVVMADWSVDCLCLMCLDDVLVVCVLVVIVDVKSDAKIQINPGHSAIFMSAENA